MRLLGLLAMLSFNYTARVANILWTIPPDTWLFECFCNIRCKSNTSALQIFCWFSPRSPYACSALTIFAATSRMSKALSSSNGRGCAESNVKIHKKQKALDTFSTFWILRRIEAENKYLWNDKRKNIFRLNFLYLRVLPTGVAEKDQISRYAEIIRLVG